MFGKLLQTAFDVVTLPVAVVADVVTLGGQTVDRNEPYTVTKAGRILTNTAKTLDTLAK